MISEEMEIDLLCESHLLAAEIAEKLNLPLPKIEHKFRSGMISSAGMAHQKRDGSGSYISYSREIFFCMTEEARKETMARYNRI